MPIHLPGGTSRPIGTVVTQDGPKLTPIAHRELGINCSPTNPIHAAALKPLGIRQVRATLYWTNWPDGSPGEIVAAAAANGLELLMLIHSPPAKFTGDRVGGTAPLAALLGERAAAWPGLSWQIMNEMDGNDGFNGGWFEASNTAVTQRQRGEWYGAVLAACSTAIRAADPTAKVIGGGIALDPADFVSGILATCPRSAFDALAVHAYGQPDIGQFASKSEAVNAVAPGVPLWCTEFGSRLSDEARQSAELLEVFAHYDGYNTGEGYERVYLYALEDVTDGYGIMSPTGDFRAAAKLVEGRKP
jgi:hypothetical protein